MEQIFTNIYETNEWGSNGNEEYNGSSGDGSTVDLNKDTYVPFLKKFITDNKIKKVVDLGCGDFLCGKLIYDDLDVSYTGYDAYGKVIEHHNRHNTDPKYEFIHLDFCGKKEEIKGGDMCILKDVIQHWSLKNIYEFLDYLVLTRKFKYILICNCCAQFYDNPECPDGSWRQLSSNFFPLKRYLPTKVYEYHTKEVSVIYTGP